MGLFVSSKTVSMKQSDMLFFFANGFVLMCLFSYALMAEYCGLG